MAKLKLRLARCLGELPNGTRYWTGKQFKPYTLISSSVRQNKVWVHMGHQYDWRAKRFEGFYRIPVWVEVKPGIRKFRRVRAYTLQPGDVFWSNKTGEPGLFLRAYSDMIRVSLKGRDNAGIPRCIWERMLVWVEVKNG